MAKLADRVDLVMTLVKVGPTEATQLVEKWVIGKHTQANAAVLCPHFGPDCSIVAPCKSSNLPFWAKPLSKGRSPLG